LDSSPQHSIAIWRNINALFLICGHLCPAAVKGFPVNAGTTGLLPQPEARRQRKAAITEAEPGRRCPRCEAGRMIRIAVLEPIRRPARPPNTS